MRDPDFQHKLQRQLAALAKAQKRAQEMRCECHRILRWKNKRVFCPQHTLFRGPR